MSIACLSPEPEGNFGTLLSQALLTPQYSWKHIFNHQSSTSYLHCPLNIIHQFHMAALCLFFCFFPASEGNRMYRATTTLKDNVSLSLEKQELIQFLSPTVKTQI